MKDINKIDYCEHPKHSEYIETFVRLYPQASSLSGNHIITVDPRIWAVSHNPKENRVKCCIVCVLSHGALGKK